MISKRLVYQVIAAVILYVVISLILEKNYDKDIFLRELGEGLVFGLVYGIFIWVRDRYFRKDS